MKRWWEVGSVKVGDERGVMGWREGWREAGDSGGMRREGVGGISWREGRGE